MGGSWVYLDYLAGNARAVGQNTMNIRSSGPTSLRKIIPLTSAVLASSVCSGYLILSEPGPEPPSSFDQASSPLTLGPVNLTEKDLNSVRELPGQGIGWTTSDVWFMPIRNSINELLSMPADWNSYGSSRVERGFAASAANLLQTVMDAQTPVPSIVPTAPGGIQIEWHIKGIDLEIEVESTSRINVLYEDHRTGVSWESEFTSDLQKLSQVVAMLSR